MEDVREAVALYLPWLVSGVTVWMTLWAGDKKTSAWVVGLAGQVLWLLWIWASSTWGLLPANIVLTLIYARNWWKWRQPAFEYAKVGKCTNGLRDPPYPSGFDTDWRALDGVPTRKR